MEYPNPRHATFTPKMKREHILSKENTFCIHACVLPIQVIKHNTNGGGRGRGKHACHMRRRKPLPTHASDRERQRCNIYMCIYIYIHIHIYVYYIYAESERDRDREERPRAPERGSENKGATETHLCWAVDEADWSKLLFPLPTPPAACCSRAILRSLRSQYVVQHRLCIFRCFIVVVV